MKIAIFFLLIFIFWLKGIIFLDPDLGWHLKYGELILKTGIPASDPFSYTMPSYNYANHEWLQDVLLTTFFNSTGLEGLSLVFAILTALIIFLSISKLESIWYYIILFFQSSIILSFTGIRPQIISWLFFVIVLKIILQKYNLFLLPVIFLIWANLHGGFVIGLVTLFIYIFSETISKRKIPAKETFILTLSILATLINPYQIKLWQEIYNSLSDPILRWLIAEWLPLPFSPHPLIIIWFFLTIFLAVRFRFHLKIFEKIVYLFLFLGGFSSVRNVPFFILATAPFLIKSSEKYFLELKAKISPILYQKIPISLFSLFSAIFLLSIMQHFQPANIKASSYPADAILFLQKLSLEGDMFAPYEWGGYLIWQYPQKKVFIDGRMPSWRWNPPNSNESSNAFIDYREIIYEGREFQSTFNKYNIKTVLWNKEEETKLTFYQKMYAYVYSTFNKLISQNNSKLQKSLNIRLEEAGWEKIYEDAISVIWRQI